MDTFCGLGRLVLLVLTAEKYLRQHGRLGGPCNRSFPVLSLSTSTEVAPTKFRRYINEHVDEDIHLQEDGRMPIDGLFHSGLLPYFVTLQSIVSLQHDAHRLFHSQVMTHTVFSESIVILARGESVRSQKGDDPSNSDGNMLAITQVPVRRIASGRSEKHNCIIQQRVWITTQRERSRRNHKEQCWQQQLCRV